jgi:hypothetical protein
VRFGGLTGRLPEIAEKFRVDEGIQTVLDLVSFAGAGHFEIELTTPVSSGKID